MQAAVSPCDSMPRLRCPWSRGLEVIARLFAEDLRDLLLGLIGLHQVAIDILRLLAVWMLGFGLVHFEIRVRRVRVEGLEALRLGG